MFDVGKIIQMYGKGLEILLETVLYCQFFFSVEITTLSSDSSESSREFPPPKGFMREDDSVENDY